MYVNMAYVKENPTPTMLFCKNQLRNGTLDSSKNDIVNDTEVLNNCSSEFLNENTQKDKVISCSVEHETLPMLHQGISQSSMRNETDVITTCSRKVSLPIDLLSIVGEDDIHNTLNMDDIYHELGPDILQPSLLEDIELYLECDEDKLYVMPSSSFSSPQKFQINLTHKPGQSSRNLKCLQCSYLTCRKHLFKDHMSRVHGEKNLFPCSFCPYVGQCFRYLQKHMHRKHSETMQSVIQTLTSESRHCLKLKSKNHLNTSSKVENSSHKVTPSFNNSHAHSNQSKHEMVHSIFYPISTHHSIDFSGDNLCHTSNSIDVAMEVVIAEEGICSAGTDVNTNKQPDQSIILEHRPLQTSGNSTSIHKADTAEDVFDSPTLSSIPEDALLSYTALSDSKECLNSNNSVSKSEESNQSKVSLSGINAQLLRVYPRPMISSHITKCRKYSSEPCDKIDNIIGDDKTICKAPGCGKIFKQRRYLKRHLQTHSDKYKCTWDGCSHKARDKHDLQAHHQTHTGIKNRKCPLCMFACIQKTSLDWHMQNKHNEMSTAHTRSNLLVL